MRYLPLTDTDRREMLESIGASSIDELFRDVPERARREDLFDLPPHQGELEVERSLAALAVKNIPAGSVPFFLGAGAYRHHIPAAVDHLIQRSEFLTSYTPYQPEVSQGTLQYLFEFQTQVSLMTGMEIANASMYDGATACAEAVMMAGRVTGRSKAILSGGLHPHYREVTITTAQFADHDIVALTPDPLGVEDLTKSLDETTACLVVQYPSFFGNLSDFTPLAESCHSVGALLIVVVTEIISLGALISPGEMGADIVVGEGQSLGNPLNFGGPYLGVFAGRQAHVRQMPGRLCGQTLDDDGRRGYTLTLATREQHIRREKATSNICTNSGLCALAFTIHLALLGGLGLARLSALNHAAAVMLAEKLENVDGVDVVNGHFFNEFTIRLPLSASEVVDSLVRKNILGGVPVSRLYPNNPELAQLLLVAATETNSEADMDRLVQGLKEVL